MYEQRYRFELVGISPLIMHWDNIDWVDQIEAKRTAIKEKDKKAFKAGDDRCPPETWKGYVYNDGNVVVLPTDNLRSSLLKAAARITLSGKTTYKSLSQSAVLFDGVDVPLLVNGKTIPWATVEKIKGEYREHVAAVQKLGFELFAKRAAVGQSKHIRVRPRFKDWAIAGELTVVDEQVTTSVLERMFTIMGLNIGLCDWRPAAPKSPGPYGRSTATIVSVKVVQVR